VNKKTIIGVIAVIAVATTGLGFGGGYLLNSAVGADTLIVPRAPSSLVYRSIVDGTITQGIDKGQTSTYLFEIKATDGLSEVKNKKLKVYTVQGESSVTVGDSYTIDLKTYIQNTGLLVGKKVSLSAEIVFDSSHKPLYLIANSITVR